MEKATAILRGYFNHELGGLIIIGVLLRMVLMSYFIWPYDINACYSGLMYFINGNDPYALHASIYPPLTYFLLFPLFSFAYQFGFSFGSHSISEAVTTTSFDGSVAICQVNPLFLVLWKLPLLCVDLLTGILIYYFARELVVDPKIPKRCFLVWFFNPFTLVVSYLHGSYDLFVAFFIVLGAFFLYKQNYFSAGLSFGLGTLTKTSPIFIALPLAVVLLFKGVLGSLNIHNLKANTLVFFKFAVGCVVPLLSFAPLFIEYLYLMYVGISKEISITGGLNQWFFAADPQRSYLINLHIGTIQTVFSYYPAICFVISVLFCKFLKLSHEKILFITAFFTNLIYFFLPITLQPQYLLWILPLLVVLSSVRKSFIWPLSLYSAAGFAFYLSLQGPQIFLYPLAMYTSLCTPEQLVKNVMNYANLPGVASQFLRQDLCTLFGGVGFLGQLLTILLLIKSLWMAKNDEK